MFKITQLRSYRINIQIESLAKILIMGNEAPNVQEFIAQGFTPEARGERDWGANV